MTEFIIDMGNSSYKSSSGLLCADVSQLREEIVRCRDCKRVTIDQGDHDYREPLWCGLFRIDVSLDGFCAWGERADK